MTATDWIIVTLVTNSLNKVTTEKAFLLKNISINYPVPAKIEHTQISEAAARAT